MNVMVLWANAQPVRIRLFDDEQRTMKESVNNMDVPHEEMKGEARVIRQGDRRRELILAAYRLIAEKGFEHLRTRDIVAQVGINVSMLHYYFASKEDLISGVMDYLLSEFHELPKAIEVAYDAAPRDRLYAMLTMIQERSQRYPEMFIVLSELVLRSVRDPALRPVLQRLDDVWHEYLQAILSSGIEQGAFRSDIDVSLMTTKVIMLIKGYYFHQITSRGNFELQDLFEDIERLLLDTSTR